jgi:hypothetical protein
MVENPDFKDELFTHLPDVAEDIFQYGNLLLVYICDVRLCCVS